MKHSTVAPHAFTEKGLYMLATILKSPMATEVTIAIVETFAKLRQVAGAIAKELLVCRLCIILLSLYELMVESITDDNVESNCSTTRKYSSKRSEFLRFNLYFCHVYR